MRSVDQNKWMRRCGAILGSARAARASSPGRDGREGEDHAGILSDDGRGHLTGCNQKSNRDPVTNYDQDDVEETLHSLRKKGAVILIEGSGRVAQWKHTLYDWLKVSKVELAVIAELLFRGPQTEGELAPGQPDGADRRSAGASGDSRGPGPRGLVVYLSPPGQKRGVFVTHGLYPSEELEKVRTAFAGRVAGDEEDAGAASAARAIKRAAPGCASLGGRDRRAPIRARSACAGPSMPWRPRSAN